MSEQEINSIMGEAFWRAIFTAELIKEKASQPLTEQEELIFNRAINVLRGRK